MRPPLGQAMAILAAACPEMATAELAALSVGERDARLLALREGTFGPRLDGLAECPRCREPLEFTLHTPDLRARPPDETEGTGRADGNEGAVAGEHTLAVEGYDVRFRLLTSQDLAAAAAGADVESARSLLVQRCVLGAWKDGRAISPLALPETVVERLAARLAECDPQAEVVLDLTCPACNHQWPAIFDVAAFFWTELSAQARRLLRQVHTLALAYGWSETDILAMSGRRRHAYLELVGA